MTPGKYYILEHPTRGVLKDLEWNDAGTKQGRFSPTGMRGDESCMRFTTVGQAHDALMKLPLQVAAKTLIRCSQPKGKNPGYLDHWPVVSP